MFLNDREQKNEFRYIATKLVSESAQHVINQFKSEKKEEESRPVEPPAIVKQQPQVGFTQLYFSPPNYFQQRV